MNISNNLTDLIGNTPLLELSNFSKKNRIEARLIAKLEYFNPLGSVKDRIGYGMIVDAEEKGLLTSESVIIEPTSGNTGIALAFVAATKGYRLILTMPENMTMERRHILKALGAELVLTEEAKGLKGAVDKAEELKKITPGSIILGQFTNLANAEIHRNTTAMEIWNDTDGKVDIFVGGVGTGGTVTGVGEMLKTKNPDVKIIAMEPAASAVLSGDKPAPHKLQGTGAGFIPEIYNDDVVDEVIQVHEKQAFARCQELAKTEGLLVGTSSGAALQAAVEIATRTENKNKTIVVLLPDTGERYLSTDLFKVD